MQLEKLTPRVLRGGVAAVALVVAIVIPWLEPPPVEVRFVYSTDAEDLLEPLIARFNDAQDDVAVNPDDEDVEEASRPSGDVLEDILEGDARPHLWMPAASTWGRLLNLAEGKEMAPEDSLSFFWSPELIGTFDSVSDDYPIEDWTDIADFATGRSPLGEGGAFRLGHTKPTSSTSGLYALLSEFSSVDPDGEPVVDDRSIGEVRSIERSVLHYGDIADDFCDQLFDYSSAYVKAFYMQETTFLKCKNEYPGLGLKEVFPDRTFIADYPAFVLNADWVGPDQEEAAARFLEWLGEELDVAAVNAQRLRYGDPWDVGGTADDPAPAGADRSQSWESIDVPAGETLAAVLDAWPDVRKPAKVLILLEKGDMHLASAIDSAKELLRVFIGDLPEDAVGRTRQLRRRHRRRGRARSARRSTSRRAPRGPRHHRPSRCRLVPRRRARAEHRQGRRSERHRTDRGGLAGRRSRRRSLHPRRDAREAEGIEPEEVSGAGLHHLLRRSER